ncbi:ATP-binding protein [Streptomyces sp. NPDC002911]
MPHWCVHCALGVLGCGRLCGTPTPHNQEGSSSMSFRTPALRSSFLHVSSDISAVSAARRRVVAIVRDWDLSLADDMVETLELLAGEVIANAVVHTGEGCQVTVSWNGTRVRLEAEDTEGGALPRRVPADLDEESGRGLQLVDGFAQAWGSRPTTDGKAVWFEVGSRLPSSSYRPSPAMCGSDFLFEGAQRPVAVAEPGCGVLRGPWAQVNAT